jgi:hypothetical protein
VRTVGVGEQAVRPQDKPPDIGLYESEMMDGYEVEIVVYRREVRKALRRICRKRTGMREDG